MGAVAGVLLIATVAAAIAIIGTGEDCGDRTVDRSAWFDGRESEAKRMVKCSLLTGRRASEVRQLLAEEDFRNGSPPDMLIWQLDYNLKGEELVVEVDRDGRVSDQYIARKGS